MRYGVSIVLMCIATTTSVADLDGDGTPWPQDCNDGHSRVRPGAADYCDGADNTCSGVVDAACERACRAVRPGPSVSFGDESGDSSGPRVVYTHDGFAVGWIDTRDGSSEVYFGQYDPFLRSQSEVRVSETPGSGRASGLTLASSGDWQGFAWVEDGDGNPEVWFRRLPLDVLGRPPAQKITSSTRDDLEPALVWAGQEWILAWSSGRNASFDIRLARLSRDGAVVAEVGVSSGRARSAHPAVAWSGNALGVVWEDDRHGEREIYFRQYDLALNPTTAEIRVTNASGESARPAIVGVGDRWIVGWQDSRDGNAEAYVATIDAAGAVSSTTRLSDDPSLSEPPRLTSTGTEVQAAWVDGAGGTARPLVARIGADAALLEAPRAIAEGEPSMTGADVVWRGEYPVVVVAVESAANILAFLPTCCGDADADGADRCVGDADDSDALVFPGASERCNGKDDDGDGEVDESCFRSCGGLDLGPPTLQASASSAYVAGVDVAWDGVALGLVWEERRWSGGKMSVQFRRFAPDGSPLGPIVRLSDPAYDGQGPGIAAFPGGWAVVFSENGGSTGEGRFLRLDAEGNALAPPASWPIAAVRMENTTLIWTGSEFAAAYGRETPDATSAHFVRFSAAGTPVAPVESLWIEEHPALAWSGSEYLVAATRCCPPVVIVRRIDRHGRTIEGDRSVLTSPYFSLFHPTLEWAGDGYGLAVLANWDRIYFEPLDVAGNASGEVALAAEPLGGSWLASPRLAWNGEQFALTWTDDGVDRHRMRRLSRDGFPLADAVDLSPRPNSALIFGRTAVVAVGGGFAGAWPDGASDPPSAGIRAIGCCTAADADGDGKCLADCDDGDPLRYPGAPERCNGADDDCNGVVPVAETTDQDADGARSCEDCDDLDPWRRPGAVERCNQLDDDCNGVIEYHEGPFPAVTTLAFVAKPSLAWELPDGPGFTSDTQRGDLHALRRTGDFATATDSCVFYNALSQTVYDPTDPPEGGAFFYSVAVGNPTCTGNHDDDGPSLWGSRNPGIGQSAAACP